ncbi:MAG: YceI family protein [Phycisphaerae bacterium]
MTSRIRLLTAALLVCLIGAGVKPSACHALHEPDAKTRKSSRKQSKTRGFMVGPKIKTHYVIDADAPGNEITFTSRAPKETIVGKATQIVGELDLKPRRLAKASGRFVVRWDALDTGKAMMNQHMTAAPWVDAASHPEIIFKLTGMQKIKPKGKSGNKLRVRLAGTMAMNGVEKKLKVRATLVYLKPDSSKREEDVREGIGIRATFKVALADFNIEGMRIGQSVAAKQRIKVALFLKRVAEEKAEESASKPKRRGVRE